MRNRPLAVCLIAFAVVAFIIAFAHGEDLDLLALNSPAWPIQDTIDLLPDKSNVGVLDWSFGESVKNTERLLATGKVSSLRVHLINGAGYNNHNGGAYEIYYKLNLNDALERNNPKVVSFLQSRSHLYCELVKASHTQLLISPILEYDHISQKALNNAMSAVRTGCPTAVPVASHRGVFHPWFGDWENEYHGNKPPPAKKGDHAYLNSLDGDDVTDININNWLKRVVNYVRRYIWSRVFNCRTNSPVFVDPRKRLTCPTRDNLEHLFHITDVRLDKPADNFKPKGCASVAPLEGIPGKIYNCSIIKDNSKRQCTKEDIVLMVAQVSSPRTWKPLAEDKGIGDKRANLPVYISPTVTKTISLIDHEGNRVGSVGYYGTFPGNLYRYYSKWPGGSGDSGWEMEKRAKQTSGNSWVYTKEGQRCFGPFLSAQRGGTER